MKQLSEVADKRLRAMKEYAAFGAGFKIALRDLEIRGAGNLLGAEQSGHMEAVGYDMYIKILEQAVLEERGEMKKAAPECAMSLKISAYIPEKYIKRPAGRIEMYKRIAAIENAQGADDVRDEMLDRYGDIPKETENLINIALVRRSCEKLGILKLEQTDGKIAFYPGNAPSRQTAADMASKFAGRVLLSMGKEPCFNIKIKSGENVISLIDEILKVYSQSAEI